MHLNTLLADVAAPQTTTTTTTGTPLPGQAPTPTGLDALFHGPLPMFVLMGVIFYFLLIRPQQKRAKEQAKLISNLKAGDKVVTTSGLIGVVIAVKDASVTLKSFDAKMEVSKSSVTQILEGSAATES